MQNQHTRELISTRNTYRKYIYMRMHQKGKKKKKKKDRAIGPRRSLREKIEKWNQSTAQRFQTQKQTSDIPDLLSGV